MNTLEKVREVIRLNPILGSVLSLFLGNYAANHGYVVTLVKALFL